MRLNVADMLRAELLNYELEVQRAESRIAYFGAVMDRTSGSKSRRKSRTFVYAKVEREAWICYRDDLLQAKSELARGIDGALGSYPDAHRKIFWECLLNEREPSVVASEMGMSLKAVERIRNKLMRDLHSLYRP